MYIEQSGDSSTLKALINAFGEQCISNSLIGQQPQEIAYIFANNFLSRHACSKNICTRAVVWKLKTKLHLLVFLFKIPFVHAQTLLSVL